MPQSRHGFKARHSSFLRQECQRAREWRGKGAVKVCDCCKDSFIGHKVQLVSCSRTTERSKNRFKKRCESKYESVKCGWQHFFDGLLSLMPYLTIIVIAIAAICLLRNAEQKQITISTLNISVEKK